jgi:Arc/MetJ-type ribon-helix-helix transcriptional regulator
MPITKRTHVVLSQQLVRDIDAIVGSRQRSSFLTQAAERELMRLRQIKALKAAAGSWKDKDHPELKGGAAKWVDKLRTQDEKRFQKVTNR